MKSLAFRSLNQKTEKALQQVQELTDESVNTITSLSNTVMSNSTLRDLLNSQPTPQERIIKLPKISQTLPSIVQQSEVIQNYIIYIPSYDTIIAPNQVFINLFNYYRSYFSYNELSLSEWKDILYSGEKGVVLLPACLNTYQGKPRQSNMLLLPFLNTVRGKVQGCIAFYLDGSHLNDIVKNTYGTDIDFVIKNGNSQVIYSNGNSQSVPFSTYDMPFMISYSSSVRTTYHLCLSQQSLNALADRLILRNTLVFGLPFSLLVLFLMIYFVNNSTVWFSITRDSQNGSLHRIQMEALSLSLAHKMVFGELSGEQEATDYFKAIHVKLYKKHMRAVLLHPCGDIEPNRVLHVFAKMSTYFQYIPNLYLLSFEDRLGTYMIWDSPAKKEENLQKDFEELILNAIQNIKNHLQLDCMVVIGLACDTYQDLQLSFSSIRNRMESESELSKESSIIWINHTTEKREDYLYPPNLEERLKYALSSGKKEMIEEMIREVYDLNRKKQAGFSSQTKQMLYSSLLLTLKNTIPSEMIHPVFKECQTLSYDDFFKKYRMLCLKTSESNKEQKEQKHQKRVDHILEYIKENLQNPDMSLTYLSSHFGMTEKYISHYLKEKGEKSFSAYLDTCRMEKANQLLRDSDMLISDISNAVGYVNVNSFRRSYQRVCGISPSAYRSRYREE